jgi:hypothetical protein
MPELIWNGKYDGAGRRVTPPRASLLFQTVETVNESAQHRQRSPDFLANDRPSDWRSRLIFGDYKEFEFGKVILPLAVLRRSDYVLASGLYPLSIGAAS